MRARLVITALAALLLVSGCGGSDRPRADRSPSASPSSQTPSPSATATATATAAPSPSAEACTGVRYDDVVGPAPSYGRRALRPYRADRNLCTAYWLAQSDDRFVPQSLAVDGTTAYVGGYRWAPTFSNRPCQIAVLDLTNGEETAFQSRFQAPIYHAEPTYCRHGGGMDLGTDGLWVQETKRLWLLDPARVGHGDPVERWWRMGDGLRGSAMLLRGDRIGVASFRGSGPGKIFWFALSDLLRPGLRDLALTDSGDRPVAVPVARGEVPRLLQGITSTADGLWYSTSGTGCGQLVAPDGHRVGSVPGAEDLQFVGSRLYVVSESGARPYISGTQRKMVPVLLGLDRDRALATRSDCTQ